MEALARGFASEPEGRWPSMDALLERLEKQVRRPRRIAMVAGLITLAAIAAGVAFLISADKNEPCPDPQPRLAGVWTPQIRSAIVAAFQATKLPYAEDTLAHILPALDRYASGWRSKQIAACRAARVERTQSETAFERRTACLDRRLAALRARAEAFQAPDARIAEKAISAVDQLPALDDCDDTEALLAYTAPLAPALRSRLAELERKLDDIEAMEARGLTKERVEAMPALLEEARSLAYPPVLARALEIQATALLDNNLSRESTLRELASVAAEAHDDARVLVAWIGLIGDLASRQGRLTEAKALEPVLIAAFARAGSPPGLVYRLEMTLGLSAEASDEYDAALSHGEKALAAARTSSGRAQARANIAATLQNMGRSADSLPYAEQALRDVEESRGPFHPMTARYLQGIAFALANTGAHDRVDALLMRALDIQERAYGPEHEDVASTLTTLGNMARAQRKHADAERWLTRAVAILEKTDSRLRYASAEASLADAIYWARGLADALPHYERAMAELEKTAGKDSLYYVMATSNYASRLSSAGDCVGARPYFEHAQAYLQKVGHAGVSMATASLAQCDLKEGKVAEAIAAYERSIAGCRTNGCSPGALEAMLVQLAGALVDSRRDRARGIALMREARAGYERLGNAVSVAEADAWLKKHGATRR